MISLAFGCRCLTIQQIGQAPSPRPHCIPAKLQSLWRSAPISRCYENYICYDLDFPLFSLYFRGITVQWVCPANPRKPRARPMSLAVPRRAFELAGVDIIDENGGGPGVRLRKHQRPKQPK